MANRSACPTFREAVELIGRRWNGVILQELLEGPRRFSELKADIPDITDAMLSLRLKDLETARIVVREASTSRPLEVRYAVDRAGCSLAPVLESIARWGEEWAATRTAVPSPGPNTPESDAPGSDIPGSDIPGSGSPTPGAPTPGTPTPGTPTPDAPTPGALTGAEESTKPVHAKTAKGVAA